ncbi:F-box/LRR-repeat protein At5g38396-like isoform X3 [Coffea arabica]|uniref:F-box/LRR-repeat protein At5g38396 isoform X3 n=1 Tax=Coffea arabica TaxID=13443 RepID=A0ABM4VD27_COFAR
MCWFGNRALPFAILVAATGAAIQKAIKSFGGQGKAIVLQEKHEQDFVHKADDGLANEDSISRLPDDLLSDVLSRLDLIEAVGTRILSRRWKNVCKVRSELHLDCLDMFRPNCSHDMGSHWVQFRFLEAVDQSLQLYSGQSITYLRISCCFMKEFEPKFTQWMQVVATLDVQELDLKFICSSLPLCQCAKSNMGMKSPPDLLNVVPILEACPHLEEFRLQLLCRGFNEERGREWPPRRLGQLKEVEFNGFHGTVNEIHFATYLVKNAPALERLWIRSPYRFYCGDYHLRTGGGWYMDERVDTLHEELMMQAVSSKLQVNIVRSPRTELKICGRE